MEERIRVSLISLGCPKNLVDSEVLLGHAVREGLLVARDPEDADVVVVNTCGFIETAREESVSTILEVARLRSEGSLKGLIVVGCLSERFGDQLRREIPELDAVVGLSDYSRIPAMIRHLSKGGDARFVADARGGEEKGEDSDLLRLLLTPRSYAYLRIGEGCDHDCTFCAIPSIRGRQRSKPIEVLVEEAKGLAASGVKELILVAEDSTAYGMDWARRKRLLPELLAALSGVEGIEWIRVLYAYPHTVLPDLTNQLRENPKVVPYLDIPIQHISGSLLRAMRRGVSSDQVLRVLHRLREEVPGIAVRTTYIVGFPGETPEDHRRLLELTRDYRFERLGVFAYSREEGTPACDLEGEVPEEVVLARIEEIMELSRKNIEARNRGLLGREIQVLVDGFLGGKPGIPDLPEESSVGRTFADAPEIDCRVFLPGSLPSGSLLRARVTGVRGYDLVAEPCPPSQNRRAPHSGESEGGGIPS